MTQTQQIAQKLYHYLQDHQTTTGYSVKERQAAPNRNVAKAIQYSITLHTQDKLQYQIFFGTTGLIIINHDHVQPGRYNLRKAMTNFQYNDPQLYTKIISHLQQTNHNQDPHT